jgi:hypothetical protein
MLVGVLFNGFFTEKTLLFSKVDTAVFDPIFIQYIIIGTQKFGYTETWRIYSATHLSDSECTWVYTYIECTGTPFH